MIAIAYPDDQTALLAQTEAERLAESSILRPEAIAAIVQDANGRPQVVTSDYGMGDGARAAFFGILIAVTVVSERLGERICELVAERQLSRVEKEFQVHLKQRLTPGTSALILVGESDAPDKAVEALSKFGGTVLASSLPEAGESKLKEALHDRTSD